MLTKNGHKFIGIRLLTYSAKIKITQTNGADIAVYPSTYYYGLEETMKKILTSLSGSGVVLGTGSTPPTMDDITISGDLITRFAYSAGPIISYGEDGAECTVIYAVTNTGTDAFTVSEIALLYQVYTSNSGGNGGAFMIDRTVLDEPVTIPAGGIGKVTYTIRMNFPT